MNQNIDEENTEDEDYELPPSKKTPSKNFKSKLKLENLKSKVLKPKRSTSNKIFTCKDCKEHFPTKRKLVLHRQLHNQKPAPYTFDPMKSLYTCITCNESAATEEEIKTHLESHEEHFACDYCDVVVTQPFKFCLHLHEHTKDGYQCPYCEFKRSDLYAVSTHIRRMHLKRYTFFCKMCSKTFGSKKLLDEHENSHAGNQFTCVVCNKDFSISSYLYQHQIRQHRVSIEGVTSSDQCKICSKIFRRQTSLEKHMLSHEPNPNKPKLLCDFCGRAFINSYKLKLHHNMHNGIKPYKCKYCDKCFTNSDYLVIHERIHSGEKPYSCEYCGKCYNQKAPLTVHRRIHTGERPYVCIICGRGFVSRGGLLGHRKSCEEVGDEERR